MALSRIDKLMDAAPGTPEMDELELLTALVEMYEGRHYPIASPDPVEAIRFRMDQLGLTQKDMAPYFGTKSKVSEVLNGKRPLSLAMMRSLNKNLEIPAEVLLRAPGANFPEEMQDLQWQKFPVVEMAKRAWIPQTKEPKEKTEESMRDFIAGAGFMNTLSPAFFRKGKGARYNLKMDIYALAAWCIRILTLARKTPLKNKYVKGGIKMSTMREITRLSYFENGPLLAREYLGKQGVHLIVVSHLPKTYLDGAALLMPDGTPVVGLTLRYDRIDYFWFCLMHELAHIARHLSASEPIIIDDLDLRANDSAPEDKIEKEADEMAREALISSKVWKKHTFKNKVNAAEVVALAERLKIHPAIIAGRVRHERNNYKLLSRTVGSKQVRKHFAESGSMPM
jgi:HTH-type transcriptional regulator / antitoxin HigA